jgi:membrane protein YqaA with SNARE-associated domain
LVFLYILAKKYFVDSLHEWIDFAKERKGLVFILFFSSELAFGLVPPEVFFVVFPKEDYGYAAFIALMMLMSVMSYFAGTLIYLLGRYLASKGDFRLFNQKWYLQYKERMEVYGSVLLVLACVTPVPYSTVCMVAGSQDYPAKKFLIISLTRIIRFVVYGSVVYYFI